MRHLEELICAHCGRRKVIEMAQGDLVVQKPNTWANAITATGERKTLCPECTGRFKENTVEDKLFERLQRQS